MSALLDKFNLTEYFEPRMIHESDSTQNKKRFGELHLAAGVAGFHRLKAEEKYKNNLMLTARHLPYLEMIRSVRCLPSAAVQLLVIS